MKQAISYIRISNRDQSNFSLSGQQQFINEYCQRKEIALINSFLDNGQSAKNFDRADWKNLETFVKANYKSIDHLVVVKYDRFSRNVSEGLAMIDKLERKYGITVLSVFEEIAISPDSPFFFKMRTDMLVQAEFELRVIRDRTNFGIRQAKREGRWVSRAPYGYCNERDEKNKPVLKIHPEHAAIVKQIFRNFAETGSMAGALRDARELGFSQHSNSAMARVLQNTAYIGMLKLDHELVKGAHEPIIDLQLFNHVQAHFSKETKIRVLINNEVPLRGVLRCTCGRLLTAGKSKGKSRHYWYYKCKSHLEVNLSADHIHKNMERVMFDLSLSEQTIDRIRERSDKLLKETLAESQKNAPNLKRLIGELEKKVLGLEEKFINNQITFQVYSSWNSAYATEMSSLQARLRQATDSEVNIWEKYRKVAGRLTDMPAIYNKATVDEKHKLLNLVFNRSLMYRLNSFITSNLMAIFAPNALILKQKGLLVINSPARESDEIPVSSPSGRVVELLQLLEAV